MQKDEDEFKDADKTKGSTPNVDTTRGDSPNCTQHHAEVTDRIEEASKKFRLVWKANMQAPVRLTEESAWPIARPEYFGLFAPEVQIKNTMHKTVREYRSILPSLSETRDPVKYDTSTESATIRSYNPSPSRYRKVQKFLKTFPKKHPKFPALQRTAQFENFIHFKSELLASKTDVKATTPVQTESNVTTRANSEILKTSESDTTDPSQNNLPTSRRSRSVESRPSNADQLAVTKSVPQSHRAPFVSKAHKSLSKLRELKEQRGQVAYSDMVQGNMIHVNNRAVLENQTAGKSTPKGQPPTSKFQTPDFLIPKVIDLDSMIPGSRILDAKIKDYDMHFKIDPQSAEELRRLYKVTILNEPTLKELLKSTRLDTLPSHLRHLVRMGSLYKQVGELENRSDGVINIEKQLKSCEQKELPTDIALNDAENLWMEAKVFSAGLFQMWFSKIKPNFHYIRMQPSEAEKAFKRLGRVLRVHSTLPTSSSRGEILGALAACVSNRLLLPALWATVDEWLDSLIGCLFSMDSTVREETCYVLAYLFTERNLVEGVRNYSEIDIGYDVTTAVLHAMEMYQASFVHFYCLLTLIIEGCPMFSILNAVIDHGPHSSSLLLNHMWPRFIYYALKYWSGRQFIRDRMILRTLNESIERAYVKGISRRNAKLAQVQLSRRFKILTKPTTVWLEEWRKFEI
ncbi:unnamed protein product [Calicophoron daubneyi]|uniref:Uncharacterized protein n=1 Tax=Calicophoron daubneyi TaxID=300641 RepID=A0AAV2TTE7_CALDB